MVSGRDQNCTDIGTRRGAVCLDQFRTREKVRLSRRADYRSVRLRLDFPTSFLGSICCIRIRTSPSCLYLLLVSFTFLSSFSTVLV